MSELALGTDEPLNTKGCNKEPFIPGGGSYVEYKGYSGINGNDLRCGDFTSQKEIEAYCDSNDYCMGYSYFKEQEAWWCVKSSADKGDPTDAGDRWFEKPIRTKTLTLDFEGHTRDYIVHIPKGYNKTEASPIVFAFHGYNNTADTMLQAGGWTQVADDENFIVVAPNGANDDGSDSN